jgi:hypothetical protein
VRAGSRTTSPRTLPAAEPEPAPAPATPLGRRFETGTLPFELLAGFSAAIDYQDSFGGFELIMPYERSLGERFLAGISEAVTVYGLPGMEGRVPTFLVNVAGVPTADVAIRLAQLGMAVWAHDSWYALELSRRLDYSGEAVRIGFIHTTLRRRSTAWLPRSIRSRSASLCPASNALCSFRRRLAAGGVLNHAVAMAPT